MLRTQGHVRLDGNPALSSSAIFPHSLIETEKNSAAQIEDTGSRIEINADSVVEFDGNEIRLEHGSLSVLTFRGLIVKIGCLVATPVNNQETRFEVTDVSGRVSVSAVKSDVYIEYSSRNPKLAVASARSSRVTVVQGQQQSRDDRCGAPGQSVPAGTAGIFNSPYTQAIAAGGIIGTMCWVFCGSGNPASPAVP